MPKKYIQTFVVDTAKWKNSHSFKDSDTYLYSKLGKQEMMCCLGFVCNQLGIPKKYLNHKLTPLGLANDWDIPYLINSKVRKFHHWQTALTSEAISINDSIHIPVAEKKRLLKKLFNEHNLNIVFKKLS